MIALLILAAAAASQPNVKFYTMHPQPKSQSTVTRWPRGLVVFAPPLNGGMEAKFRAPCKKGWHERGGPDHELYCVRD